MSNPTPQFTVTAPVPAFVSPTAEPRQVRIMRYSPWRLASSVSGSLLIMAGATLIASQLALWFGFLAFAIALPFPIIVIAWAREAWDVERERLAAEFDSLLVKADTPPTVTDRQAHLRPGYTVDGQMQSPPETLAPEMLALKTLCLKFVKAGMRRGGWSHSKLAEGKDKLITPDEWSTASKELQHLGFFRNDGGTAGLQPAKPIDEIKARLEAAR